MAVVLFDVANYANIQTVATLFNFHAALRRSLHQPQQEARPSSNIKTSHRN